MPIVTFVPSPPHVRYDLFGLPHHIVDNLRYRWRSSCGLQFARSIEGDRLHVPAEAGERWHRSIFWHLHGSASHRDSTNDAPLPGRCPLAGQPAASHSWNAVFRSTWCGASGQPRSKSVVYTVSSAVLRTIHSW